VASSKTRQRKLARAKMERQMARRAARVRRRRQVWAGVVVALVVVLGTTGTVWALGGFSPSKKTPEATGSCLWAPADKTANDKLKDVGTPPTSAESHTGTETMTINLNSGTVVGSIDLAKAPCTGASLKYLAGKHFFDNTTCHRLTTADTYLLQCGDPTGTGQGGPLYTYANENVPTAPQPSDSPSTQPSDDASAPPAAKVTYPRGTLAMAAGSDTNGSQFYIIYKDTQLPADYTVFGTVTQGLDVIDKIAAAGAVDEQGKSTGDGKPKNEVKITTLTVVPPPSPVPSGSGSPSVTPSAPTSPSAKS
jgi:peptidyl-prolyl cis-trans isomerase B (cyclophilin B)